jgi:DNA-binding Lrp family transcriptional regulator
MLKIEMTVNNPLNPSKLAKISDGSGNSQSQFIRLLDALKRYGPRNLSLLSMVTGIPRETVRYKVKKQLRELGFRINMIPNLYRMGLTRQLARIRFTDDGLRIAKRLLHELGKESYLTYHCKIAFKNEYLAILTPPQRYSNLFREYLEDLERGGIIQDFEIRGVTEVGYPHVSYQLFDFEQGVWRIPDKEYDCEVCDVVVQKASADEQTNYLIDSLDLSIITELLNDAFVPMTRISPSEKRDPRLLRYHLQEHIVRKGLIAGYVIGWYPAGVTDPSIAKMWLEIRCGTRKVVEELFRKFISTPYCKFYQVLDDDTFVIFLEIYKQFRTAIKYMSNKLSKSSVEGEIYIIEDADAYALTRELFRDGYGWIKTELKIPPLHEESLAREVT